ncbi:MAG: hypothetical protein MUO39_06880 [Steroidobacteraceae bacterium]|nr:hypothetical protein [Steroidobacteraceae bacterium]
MRRRYAYVLLFAVPALLAAAIVAVVVGAAAAGGMWLFVFGDNPWPASAGTALTVLFLVAGVATWAGLLAVAYAFGKKQEERATASLRPVVTAVGATAILALAVVFQQWRVGNLGPKSVDVLCSEYCREKGFTASATSPRDSGDATCGCFDVQGHEAVKVPIGQVTPNAGER